jgi:hypothetical protein
MNKPSKIAQTLSVISGLVLFASAAYLVWIIFSRLFLFLERANPSVSAAIVGAMATILVGVGGVLYTQAQTKKREIEEAHRPKKVEIYKDFLHMVSRMMANENPNISLEAPTEQELLDYLVGFQTDLMLWGSPTVINSFLNFRKISTSGGNVLFAVDDLYKAIRDDIGLSNSGLNKHQLIKMHLKEPDELDLMVLPNNESKR